ncbi:hypothetical protein HY636_05290 [Candidatus Woesearchaeota archaeon]|nr:hypothetical protein [Candidatus Woesearchaeota archaeon]
MEKENIKKVLEELKKNSKKRKFKQSYDLIINLQGLDLKKPEQHVDFYTSLHYGKGKKLKICAFVGPEMSEEAKKVCDLTVNVDEFNNLTKQAVKKMANEFDYFIAQANIMGKVAAAFGKVLGPRGKMPNPKAGCVFLPKAQLQPLYDKLQKTIRVSAKTALMIQCAVGKEDMKDEEIIDNVMTIYTQVVNSLPNHDNNIKLVSLKLTMSKPMKVA